MADDDAQPTVARVHRGDAYATKVVDKTNQLQEKAGQKKAQTTGHGTDGANKDKGPAGGFYSTPVPHKEPGYTVKFTFHRARNLPFADINSLSSDPYLLVQLNTALPMRHKEDPYMRFRSPTIRRNTEPEWNCDWVVANVPATGFTMKIRIYDEDPADHDDRLGDVHVHVDHLSEEWPGIHEQGFDVKKRKGSKRAYLIRGCAAMFSRGIPMTGTLIVSAQVLERTEPESKGRLYTVGPCNWNQHLSPLIGRLAGTKNPEKQDNGEKGTERYNFQANQIQLAGPVPEELYHRYVEFKPFVAGMFNSRSLRGRLLNRTLHHQHAHIYNYDRSTIYGSFPSPSKELTLQFLDLVHHDRGGRIFTYVLTLDGLWRFTETGKEFGIDLLSKHTMHSNVSIFIAFSGEFFIRRLKNPRRDPSDQESHPPTDISGGPPQQDPPKDPAFYHLVIDNDSGTYRPNNSLLPLLKLFLHRNLPGLKISTLDCMADKEKMDRMKTEQRERRKAEGETRAFVQGDDDSSVSSSDEEDLAALEGRAKRRGRFGKAAHDVKEPKDRVRQWIQGDGERERREEEEEEEDLAGGGGMNGVVRQGEVEGTV